MAARLRVTQVKSAIGYKKDQGVTLKALGLGKMWRSVEKDDTPAIRGMLNKVRHLVRVEEATALPERMARPAEFTVLALPVAGEEAAEKPRSAPTRENAVEVAPVDEATAGALESDAESVEEPAKPVRRPRKPKPDATIVPPAEASAAVEETPAKPRRSRKAPSEGPETPPDTDEGEIVS